MSIFPAYSKPDRTIASKSLEAESSSSKDEQHSEESWLKNPGFSIDIGQVLLHDEKRDADKNPPSLLQEKSLSSVHHKRKKSSKHKKLKKHKHSRTRHEDLKITIDDDNDKKPFYEDKNCEKKFLSLSSVCMSDVPIYYIKYRRIIGQKNYDLNFKKRKHKDRYYKCSINTDTTPLEEKIETVDIPTSSSTQIAEKDEQTKGTFSSGSMLEEELTKKTGEYNKSLTEHPKDIQLWLKYVRFQDLVHKYEKTYRRGGGISGVRVLAERKLSIIDKALQYNPDSEDLLKETISLTEQIYPADILSRKLADMLEKQPNNLALWHGYISATQCSLAHCTIPAVMDLYNKALTRLHQFRRGTPSVQTKPTEQKILALLQDFGLFLRQAGLWEQLWLLFKLYLELNLTQAKKNQFKVNSSLPEETVTEAEEQIISSQLPLSELWLRVEQLREGAHWLPWSSDEDCEDPQRLVFADDVSDFIHPITTSSLLPHLATTVLTLLKVPLLPCRDTMLSTLGISQKPYSFDAVEMLLPALFPIGTLEIGNVEFLKNLLHLTVGPQYLNQKLGQENYLEFVIQIFRLCADCLEEPTRTAFCVWWLRFERLLLVLDRLNISKLPQHRKKKLKSVIKDFLKQDCNRNTLLFYQEYALIEWELGHHEAACKILTTAINAQPGGVPVVSVLNEQLKAGLGCLYRTLCEMYVKCINISADKSTFKHKAIGVLLSLSSGTALSDAEVSSGISMEQLASASEKFHHITTELIEDSNTEAAATLTEHLLPDFYVEWINCHTWLLFLTHSPWAAGALLEDELTKRCLPLKGAGSAVTKTDCRREAVFEIYVNILDHHCTESFGAYSVFKEVLLRAMKEFPSNLYFLTSAAKLQTSTDGFGYPLWKMIRYFTEADSLLAQVFTILLTTHRHVEEEKASLQSHTFLYTAGPVIPDNSSKNRLHALFNKLKNHHLAKRCPLIWRLYMQFLYNNGTANSCKTAFYRSVEECPWVKALYIDAAKYIPEDLSQIQDLIIEKEIRLHVTPEELDVLRSDPT